MLKASTLSRLDPMSVGGLWGHRLKDSVTRWSLQVNEDTLLDCFRHRPGRQSFIGEHAGKFLDGAILDNLIVEDPWLWEKDRPSSPGTYGLSGTGRLSWHLYARYALDRTGNRAGGKQRLGCGSPILPAGAAAL